VKKGLSAKVGLDGPRLPRRFWTKITPEPNTGCWLWMGSLNRGGYGRFGIGSRTDDSRRTTSTHRLAYETLRPNSVLWMAMAVSVTCWIGFGRPLAITGTVILLLVKLFSEMDWQ
jgi:hypothetical protein